MTVLERDKVLYDIFGMVWYSMFGMLGHYMVLSGDIAQYCAVWFCDSVGTGRGVVSWQRQFYA